MKKKKALATIWEIPDELWKRMAPLILEMDPPKETGRPRANPRNVMDAIIFRIRTGCQWNHIPRVYGDDSTIHRTFQHWVEIDLFPRLWALVAGPPFFTQALKIPFTPGLCPLGRVSRPRRCRSPITPPRYQPLTRLPYLVFSFLQENWSLGIAIFRSKFGMWAALKPN